MTTPNLIHPFRHGDQWVFDDPAHDLRLEPLVSGADTLCDRLDAEHGAGFALAFSDMPVDEWQPAPVREIAPFDLHYSEPDTLEGWWYFCPHHGLRVWLCPALLCYFTAPPITLFLAAFSAADAALAEDRWCRPARP